MRKMWMKAVVAYLKVQYCQLPKEVQENIGRCQQYESRTYPNLVKKNCGTAQMVIVVFSTQ
jgi:hypothetical protein